jgi:hypothetical protein
LENGYTFHEGFRNADEAFKGFIMNHRAILAENNGAV